MRLADFNYSLPADRIARYPAPDRAQCRLLVVDRRTGAMTDTVFAEITRFIGPGDCLVLNNTKVIPARLFGRRKTGGRVEIFLLEKKDPVSEALVRPSARLDDGEVIILESGDAVTVLGRGETGRYVRFSRPVDAILCAGGHMPLPPYIDRPDEVSDRDAYQTVYAAKEGATASPTAGLHFTTELIEAVKRRGARLAFVTLHTNYGTFQPVKTDEIEAHRMHKEYFELSAETIAAVRATRAGGGAVFAVGTTSCRVLEHNAALFDAAAGEPTAVAGYTDLYIYPGYRPRIVDHLVTNFHLPQSTLLILVSALAGRELIMRAYREAIAKEYRFFSYGDAMLIL